METSRVGRLQGPDPQRMGGHEKLGRAMGRGHHGGSLPQGVRQLSIVGASRHRRHGVRGERNTTRSARSDRGRSARYGGLPRIALALLTAILVAACEGRAPAQVRIAPPPRNDVNFATVDSPSLQFLPRQQEAKIWRLDEDPIVIPGDHLNTYLGTIEAPQFARYDTLDLTIGKYSAPGTDGFATVEIFRFPDFVKAFGAYSKQKNGNLRFLNIPNESFAKVHSVHVWRGPFYVRITGAGVGDSVLRLATFVSDRMPPAPSKPAVFAFLPDAQRVAGSERYSADSAFGQPFLGNSFQATFKVDTDVIEGIVIPAENKQAAENILDQYKGLYLHNG